MVRQLAALERLAGSGYARALARLPADVRVELEETGMLSWCRQSAVRAATLEVACELGVDPVELAGDVVEESVDTAFRGVWGVFLRHSDDASLVRRASSVFEKSFDRGAFEAHLVGPNRAQLTLRGWDAPHDMDLESISRSIRVALVVAGRVPPRVTITRANDHVAFDVEFQG